MYARRLYNAAMIQQLELENLHQKQTERRKRKKESLQVKRSFMILVILFVFNLYLDGIQK